MLMLTDNATTVVRALVDRPELPDSAGLRVASPSDGSEGLTISTETTPQQGDSVLENEGARVFLEPGAAEILDDKVLDARVDDKGKVEFLLAPQ
jgi:Fe-S cluster assembly iron-binding protein IscA